MNTVVGRCILIGSFLLLASTSATPLPAETQPQPATEEQSRQPAEHAPWLDNYLATELQYDAAQIRQFKANIVGDMSKAELEALVARLKQVRGTRSDMHQFRLKAHRENVRRVYEARSRARARPIRQAPYEFASHSRRPPSRNPRSYGLFRGYTVFLGEIAR